jgi:hypothetical protein
MTEVYQAVYDTFQQAGVEAMRPSVVFKPTISQDGDMWLAILGDLPTGVVGTGKTPSEAMYDFDLAWYRPAKAEGR